MFSLRQKTYGVFIRPYVEYGGDRLIQRGALYVLHPCQNTSASCTQYISVKDGQGWILYKGEYLTSFALVRERVKELMDKLNLHMSKVSLKLKRNVTTELRVINGFFTR